MKLSVKFYKSDSGKSPVEKWLSGLFEKDRMIVLEDIKTVQYGFPIGMPLVKPFGDNLWEIRSRLGNAIARIFFTLYEDNIILLHGFVKKSQKTPLSDIRLAKKRKGKFYEDLKT